MKKKLLGIMNCDKKTDVDEVKRGHVKKIDCKRLARKLRKMNLFDLRDSFQNAKSG
jgi:hypothetical protein